MARMDPDNFDLTNGETHVAVRVVLHDGQVKRYGSAKMRAVLERDDPSARHYYEAHIQRDSDVTSSLLRVADTASVSVQNVDRQIGITLNDPAQTLTGAKVKVYKVFMPELPRLPTWTLRNGFVQDPDLSLRKTSGGGDWATQGGSSESFLPAGGSLEFTIPGINYGEMVVGLSSNSLFTFGQMEYAVHVRRAIDGTNAQQLRLMEGGAQIGAWRPYSAGDPVVLHHDGLAVQFYHKGTYVATAPTPPPGQLFVTVSANNIGDRVPPVYIRRGNPVGHEMLTGEISDMQIDEETGELKVVADLSPGVAYISTRPVQKNCPLVFKGERCGYVGPLTTCNKIYESEDGCSGRNRQHRYGGVIVRGELNRIIPGSLDMPYDYPGRFPHGGRYPYYPDPIDGRYPYHSFMEPVA
jgi:hypothetical protein